MCFDIKKWKTVNYVILNNNYVNNIKKMYIVILIIRICKEKFLGFLKKKKKQIGWNLSFRIS